jgi:coatomer protein complex subunit gamma
MSTSKKVIPLFDISAAVQTFFQESVFSLAALEAKLVVYMKDPEAANQAFDTSSVPKISRVQAAQDAARE